MRMPSHQTNSARFTRSGGRRRSNATVSTCEKPSATRRRLELALQAELRAGTEGAGIAASRATELLGVQQPSVPPDQASDGVDLGVLDGGGQVDTSRGQPEPAGGGDDRRP